MRIKYAKLSLVIFCLGVAACCKAQNGAAAGTPADTMHSPVIKEPFEEIAQFPGGEGALLQFLKDNIRYPVFERMLEIEGKVIIKFIVMEDGSVDSAKVVRPVSKGLDDESLRVVRLLPKFKPGTQGGKRVRVIFNLPVMFKLTGDRTFFNQIENLALKDKNFNTGLTAMRQRNFKTAIKLLKKSAVKYKDGNIYELLWVCYKEKGDLPAMCAALNKAIQSGHTEELENLEKLCK